MRHKIVCDLSPSGVRKAIEELNEYKRWLDRKCEELKDRIAQELRKDASYGFHSSPAEINVGEEPQIGTVEVVVEEQGDMKVVIAYGEDAVWIEFGAGVYYNGSVGSSPHPNGTELGFTIGSMSTVEPKGKPTWTYIGADGERHTTHGTPASMPFYMATMRVIQDLPSIAKEVFSS